jgi:hypothetical protein
VHGIADAPGDIDSDSDALLQAEQMFRPATQR